MPRPATKTALLNAADERFSTLLELAASLPKAVRDGPFAFDDRDRNLRDVLGHLHEWHLLFLGWYRDGQRAAKPQIPAPGITWAQLPVLNRRLWEKCQRRALEPTRKALLKSHRDVVKIIEQNSNTKLFTKSLLPWTGSTSLGAYCVGATSSHYDWAIKKLKLAVRKNAEKVNAVR